jgi:serine/threonine protein kinase
LSLGKGRIKLCDFGYASKFTTQKNIDANEIIGTLEYLSPEYVQGLDTGPLRDIWAIGILCFELWTGKNPFQELKENEKWMKLVKVIDW